MNAVDGTIIDASFIGVSTLYLVRAAAMPKRNSRSSAQNSATSCDGSATSDLLWHPEHTFGLHEGAWRKPKPPRSHRDASRQRANRRRTRSSRGRRHGAGRDRRASTGCRRMAPAPSKKLTPYFLLLPAALVMVVFFLLPR